MICGIDPGASGALAILDNRGAYVAHMLMPSVKLGKSTRVNGAAVAAFLREHPVNHVYLERVAAMPGQGVASMFTFGHAAGLVEGVVTGMGLPMDSVTPQAWKRAAGLIGTDKDASRSRAVQLYPDLRILDLKAKGQAVADALLIARFGMEAMGRIAGRNAA